MTITSLFPPCGGRGFFVGEMDSRYISCECPVKEEKMIFQIADCSVDFFVMRSETKVTIEKAARILGTDVDTLLNEIYEVGITVQHDRGSGYDYISASDFEDLKESMGVTEN